MDIGNKIRKGLNWSFLNQGYSLISQFTLGIWLARILGPEVYGTIAMVTVFSSLAQMLMDFGFSAALIQKQDVTKKDYSTIFWFNLLVGILIFFVFFFCSNLIAEFYKKDELALYAKVLGIQFVLSAFAITQRVQLTKKIDFKTKTIISISSSLLSFIVAIVVALGGYGVWSIIFQILFNRVISIILLYYFVSWAPMIYFSKSSFKSLYRFGLSVTGDTFVNYLSRNTDNLLIGKFLGDSSLGIYSKSYSIILFPIKNFSGVIKSTLFPSFSLIQSDHKLIKQYYLKTTSAIIYIIFPVMILINILAEELVIAFFGNEWIEMIPLVQIFSVLGMIQSILTLNGTIYLSLGKANLAFKVTLITTIVTLVAIGIGVYTKDIYNVAISLCIAQVINFPLVFLTATKLIKLTIKEFMIKNMTVFLIIFFTAGFTYLFSFIRLENIYLSIVLITLIFLSIYLSFSYMLKVDTFVYLKSRFRNFYKNVINS